MIYITAWEYKQFIRDISHICSVQGSGTTTTRDHFRAWAVLKLPCTEGQEVIRLFLAICLFLTIFSSPSYPPATPQRLYLSI